MQVSELKGILETLRIKRSQSIIFSMDAIAMYPSIKFRMIRKAVNYFARDLSREMQGTIQTCLDMIKFGMANTLLKFQDMYYKYGGNETDVADKGLTIGGYESAWLADLVAAFILENLDDIFDDALFSGIYRDDGIIVKEGILTKQEIAEWKNQVNKRAEELVGSDHLKFTVGIWDAGGVDDGVDLEGFTVCNEDLFPYLDMEFYWSGGDLLFQVHMKPNQQVKYLNQGSAHRKDVFKAIPSGVMGRLAKLTSRTEENGDVRMDVLYPEHATDLSMSDLAPSLYPTLREL